MEMDEMLKWCETRINSSLRPRNEELKNMIHNADNRRAFREFLSNEDVRSLFVSMQWPRQLSVSLQPPTDLRHKSVFFLKNNVGVKLAKDNIDNEVMCQDCASDPLLHLDLLTREVFLPLLCVDSANTSGINSDKLLDLLHRVMAAVQTAQGQTQGVIQLALPSIEILAEAAAHAQRRGAVLHVLETTVIGWIKQIKNLLKHDPVQDIGKKYGENPGPMDELSLWELRLEQLDSVTEQLGSPVAEDILDNLEEANSTYATSFNNVRKDITKAREEAAHVLLFLGTMTTWLADLHSCHHPQRMLKLFTPLIHTLLLVWTHSKYYHQSEAFHGLLRLISNEVVHRAQAVVGEDVLREPLQSYSQLKEALRVCAAFRGTYLDYRDKAQVINDKNQDENDEKRISCPQGQFTLFSTKMYGAHAYTPRYGLGSDGGGEGGDGALEAALWTDSPWPPRNAAPFDLLNSFMERCNDVLELVQTTRHFRLLADAAAVGGAGTPSLDALVRDIHARYSQAMDGFFLQVSNVLAIDGSQTFEKAFFAFRTVVKDLERKLSEILRQSFLQCPTTGAQLRLLEVFEGISSRELVQAHLKDKDRQLVTSFTEDLIQVHTMFTAHEKDPPAHGNMPPVVSKLFWTHALRQRIELPMLKMKKISPQSLDGDLGWKLRDAYAEATRDVEGFETRIVSEWRDDITTELTQRLKQPLLVADEPYEDEADRPPSIHVNLDPKLLLLLREIHYLSQDPFNLALPAPARELIRNTDSWQLRTTATRLDTIVSKYNAVMRTMTEVEQPLFERLLAKIDHLFQEGLTRYTWRTEESADFIEKANALVCIELHRNLDIVQSNSAQLRHLTAAWCQGQLDVFSARDPAQSYDMHQLVAVHHSLKEEFETLVVPMGNKIHQFLHQSFLAAGISEASPAWQDYVSFQDAIVLGGLKEACWVSLHSMYDHVAHAKGQQENHVPILTIRLELIEKQVAFRPPLDQSTTDTSVQETVRRWLQDFRDRGLLVKMLSGQGSYRDYMAEDTDIKHLMEQITTLVHDNAVECNALFELFHDYSFLWHLDVNQTFDEFLKGHLTPNPLRQSASRDLSGPPRESSPPARLVQSRLTDSRESSGSGLDSRGVAVMAERSFVTPKVNEDREGCVTGLEQFEAEIDIYKTARDEILALQDLKDVGWLRVDLRPIKQVLITYSSKWMWTFTKYLAEQVTQMLDSLDQFLKRTEPDIEGITGEERDTASFMRLMRLFNEVSAQSQEMDGRFATMHQTVDVIKKYGHKLPTSTQKLFDTAPARWSSLKTKVALAKQRLGPRIQEEADGISKDLRVFGDRVEVLQGQLDTSEVYERSCSLGNVWVILDNFSKRLTVLENEAQDLIELQDLLESSVVDFRILPQCHHDLTNLKQVWEAARVVGEQQAEWQRHRWQSMDIKSLREETDRQLAQVKALPEAVLTWDVYMGLHDSITSIQASLPLIDDLSNPAMRTRHWKQLVRVTGGAVQIDNDTLKRMTLGELLSLGLQQHVDDVRAIVQRAVKDLAIESSLKTYEEVWLSKVFDLREHVRNASIANAEKVTEAALDTQSEVSQLSESVSQQAGAGAGGRRAASRMSNPSSLSRTRRTSASSLPASLLNVGEDSSSVVLLDATDAIFDELENHQVALQAMQGSSAAGSFLDEVVKWQRKLQTIEAVLGLWLDVQGRWLELEEVYSSQEVKTLLSHDAHTFAVANRDFRLLMRATERNPNVLQCCERKNLQGLLERINGYLEQCQRSLLSHLEKRRHRFPRLYFLSMQDVLHIVCYGYDLNQVNVYISKLLDNVGSMVFWELHQPEKYQFQVEGVRSLMGERLSFSEPVPCEGNIEAWLGPLVATLKASLYRQLAEGLGLQKPMEDVPRKRQIHSAGARRVTLPSRTGNRDRNTSRTTSRQGSRQSHRQDPLPPAEGAQQPGEHEVESGGGVKAWPLDHVAEVVHLVTKIQLTEQTTSALLDFDGGNKDALEIAIAKVNATIATTVAMLKRSEDDKRSSIRKETIRPRSQGSMRQKEVSDTISDSASQIGTQRSAQAPSQRGSMLDITVQQSPILEEGSRTQIDGETDLTEPSTTEPVDTMTLTTMPPATPGGGTQAGHENHTLAQPQPSGNKTALLPYQLQKISSLIAVLGHQRELLRRLQGAPAGHSQVELSQSFAWRTQLQYAFSEEEKIVQVKCIQNTFKYGFEYQGSARREIITPATEKVFVSLSQAVRTFTPGLLLGQAGGGKIATVRELSHALGMPLYEVNCTRNVDSGLLRDVFKGLALTGCWLAFNNMDLLQPEVLSILSQLLSSVMTAWRASKTTLQCSGEELPLASGGACFAVMEAAVGMSLRAPDRLLLLPSAATQLPRDLAAQFRTVSLLQPEVSPMVETLLLSQAFENAEGLARKVALLYDQCRKLMGTNTPLVDHTNQLMHNANDNAFGWNPGMLKRVVAEAAAMLDAKANRKSDVEDVEGEHELQRLLCTDEDEKEEVETQTKVESESKDSSRDEEEVMVAAIRNVFMPRLAGRDASVLGQLLKDLWPDVTVPTSFSGGESEADLPPQSHVHSRVKERDTVSGNESTRPTSKPGSRSQAESTAKTRSFRDGLNLNPPVVPINAGGGDVMPAPETHDVIDDIDDAIAVATSNVGLMPGVAFQARVSQLAQLSAVHRTVIVAGPAGCGKSECIKTFALAERERGKLVDVQGIYNKAVESRDLFGQRHPQTHEWQDGIFASLLRKMCARPSSTLDSDVSAETVMKIIQLDGQVDALQLELLESVLHSDGAVVLGNNERLTVPETLRFLWETDSMAHVSPGLLGNVGVLVMSGEEVMWQLTLAMWLDRRTERGDAERELLNSLCDQYLVPAMEFLAQATRSTLMDPARVAEGQDLGGGGGGGTAVPRLRRVVSHADQNLIYTFTGLLEAYLSQFPDLTEGEVFRYFTLATVWALGGTLDGEGREHFSLWWRRTFAHCQGFPVEGTVFDYMLDAESHQFVSWSDVTPAYSAAPRHGIPNDAFVHSVSSEQLLHVLGVLTDYGRPVILMGGSGCGKSTLIQERLRTVGSGEVAEVQGLCLQANRFTTARLLYQQLEACLEWKHGKAYIPKGGKRLLYFVDDLNLSQVDEFQTQSAAELIRQHLDDGGFYDPETLAWKYVANVTYVSSVNPHPAANAPALSPRLLRHFAVFVCPYPCQSEQRRIFSTLLHNHFITPDVTSAMNTVDRSTAHHLGINDEKTEETRDAIQHEMKEEEEALKALLTLIVKVTIELQDKLRCMYLATPDRCHYVFTLKDLGRVFRNLSLSLTPGCNKDHLLLLWEHECHWVYGRRMVSEVDYSRFHQCYVRAVRKDFQNDHQIRLLGKKEKPIYSSLHEQDSGLVTAGNYLTSGTEAPVTDLYQPVYDVTQLEALMAHGVEEYNKSHPRIKLALYRDVIEQVCRVSRVISSPHQVAHCVLGAAGGPGRCDIIARLAGHLCGFSVVTVSPTPMALAAAYTLRAFKADLVAAYTRAGVKSEKVLFLLIDDQLTDDDFLVYLSEFIVSGAISHLFTFEEQTTIINSIRTEVTQAGLTYTRDVAWEFFLKTVRQNFRVCFVCSDIGAKFQRRCRLYPNFAKAVNFMWFPHWSKKQLIHCATYHLKDIAWLDRVERENVAHLLATMHTVIRQQDCQELGSGRHSHLTNLAFEKLVESFISLANARYGEIKDTHSTMLELMKQIQLENKLATKLKRELEHEKIVLEERKSGTVQILAQIGQDTAITKQQIKIVQTQTEKIHNLEKLLPEYQVAHERAVYKTVAIVADTKKLVQQMDVDGLAELRATQKPIVDLEDIMAAIIMLLKKNPHADLTWQKGAKRQMANLERFLEELLTFDDEILPESTLVLVEPYLKKPSFDPATLEKKTGNKASASLCKWVKGVCRYHRMMISRVKPLHKKVEDTTIAIETAQHKMSVLENKRTALEARLADLAKGFEEAAIDKNKQVEKTTKMNKMLETAARLKKVLRQEYSRIQQIIDSLPRRLLSIPGGVAMAAAFTTYLGPYQYRFRRLMLTVHWPNCLRERGMPLVIDTIHPQKGRVLDWQIEGLQTASGASTTALPLEDIEEESEPDNEEDTLNEEESRCETAGTESPDERADAADKKEGEDDNEEQGENEDGEEKKDTETEKETEEKLEKDDATSERSESPENDDLAPEGLTRIPEEGEDGAEGWTFSQRGSGDSHPFVPLITDQQYQLYIRSLLKLVVGPDRLQEWIVKDFRPSQLENAAILLSSWQRPPLILDPLGNAVSLVKDTCTALHQKKPVLVDMDTRSDPQSLINLERAILHGYPVLLQNCADRLDSVVAPLIYHRNTAHQCQDKEEQRLIHFCSRRILCHPDFRLYMTSPKAEPRFSPAMASMTSLINCGASEESLREDLTTRAFARVRPELYRERRTALKNVFINENGLLTLYAEFRDRLHASVTQSERLFDEDDVDIITDMTLKTNEMVTRLENTQSVLGDLDALKDEFLPLGRRASMLYGIMRCLSSLGGAYQFSMTYFVQIYDDVIGGELPENFCQTHSAGPSEENLVPSVTPKRLVGLSALQLEYGGGQGEHNEEDDDTGDDEKGANEENNESAQSGDATPAGGSQADRATEKGQVQTFELPEVAPLPSDGVEYNGLDPSRVDDLIQRLTTAVLHKVNMALRQEHRLLFETLLCLCIERDTDCFTMEEMSLLLQGNPGLGNIMLSLADFGSDAAPPDWLPGDKWEDLLALSVMAGPLEGACVHVAREAEAWREWYSSSRPEDEALPLKQGRHVERDNEDVDKDLESEAESKTAELGEFHKLILLRLLRPDRFHIAMETYVAKRLHANLSDVPEVTFSEVKEALGTSMAGVLVLLDGGENLGLECSALVGSAMDNITRLAQSQEVKLEVLTVGEGVERDVMDAVENMENENTWVVVQQLHLASDELLMALRRHIQKIMRHRDEKGVAPAGLLWLTGEPCDTLPVTMTQRLFQLSCATLQRLAAPPSTAASPAASGTSRGGGVRTAITASFKALGRSAPELLESLPRDKLPLVYGLGLAHGILAARQTLGTRGMSQFYPLHGPHLTQAVAALVSMTTGEEVAMATVVQVLAECMYGQLASSDWDEALIKSTLSDILGQIVQQSGSVQYGGLTLPVASSLDPARVGEWFDDDNTKNIDIESLWTDSSIEREVNDSVAAEFLTQIEQLYDALYWQHGGIPDAPVDMLRLRAILDKVLEQLPPLLELGAVPGHLARADYDFPYHRPSVVSMATADGVVMPKTIGFVLLQECLWLNSLLCHVRQNCHVIHSCLLSGPESFPVVLRHLVTSLMEESVPSAWVHPKCRPSTHSLTSWLTDVRRRHSQMRSWVRQQMIPVFSHQSDREPPQGHGCLTTVWLGGLVNPQALLAALTLEKAAQAQALWDEVEFSCEVCDGDACDVTDTEGGLLLTDLYMQGAEWSNQDGCLVQSRQDMRPLSKVFLQPVVRASTPGGAESERGPRFDCPVFISKARQVCNFRLSLPCKDNNASRQMALSGAAIILDPGIPENESKKSRALARSKIAPRSVGRSEGSSTYRTEHGDVTGRTGGASEGTKDWASQHTNRSDQSQKSSVRSQLSYRPMSPQAPPLPPDLQLMHREQPVGGTNEDVTSQKESLQKQSPKSPSSVSRPSSSSTKSGKISNRSGEKSDSGSQRDGGSQVSMASQGSASYSGATKVKSSVESPSSDRQSIRSLDDDVSSRHSSSVPTKSVSRRSKSPTSSVGQTATATEEASPAPDTSRTSESQLDESDGESSQDKNYGRNAGFI